jgi:hypothetical protein
MVQRQQPGRLWTLVPFHVEDEPVVNVAQLADPRASDEVQAPHASNNTR